VCDGAMRVIRARICEYTVQIGQASVRQPSMHIMSPARASRKYVLCVLACAIER